MTLTYFVVILLCLYDLKVTGFSAYLCFLTKRCSCAVFFSLLHELPRFSRYCSTEPLQNVHTPSDLPCFSLFAFDRIFQHVPAVS
jgi:hypothetical protein